MENANKQTPATVNQITNTKPNIERTFATFDGNISGSMNAGHNKTIAWFRVMQGQRIQEYKQALKIKLLTPLTASFQDLKMTVKSYFVPDKRVYAKSEEFVAQNGGYSQLKVKKKPNTGGKIIPMIDYNQEQTHGVLLSDTTAWRDSWISAYIPRVGFTTIHERQGKAYEMGVIMPEMDACLLRGRIAIRNDFERNKEHQEAWAEYNGETMSDTEWNSYLPTNNLKFIDCKMRARRNNSYFTDYRMNMQGFEEDLNVLIANTESQKMLLTWANAEAEIAEARSQAEMAQMNPWEVLHKLYGTARKLSEGKTQLIGQYTFNLNYSSITQSTYNTATGIQPEFKIMGTQGAYSYTEIIVPCFAAFEAIEGGWVHVIATVTADTVFERAFDRTALAVNWDDEYRPDLKDQKLDTLKTIEIQTVINEETAVIGDQEYEFVGFKRKWNEYFKLPNIVQGDTTSVGYFDTMYDQIQHYVKDDETLPQATYQFYEEMAIGAIDSEDGQYIGSKNYYLDYSDLVLNRNQAYKNEVVPLDNKNIYDFAIHGQNQIYFVGKHYITTDLPMDEDIKNNFTKWGEH